MDRRTFIATAANLLAAPLAAEAQTAGKIYRIGFRGGAIRVPEATGGPLRWP